LSVTDCGVFYTQHLPDIKFTLVTAIFFFTISLSVVTKSSNTTFRKTVHELNSTEVDLEL